MKIKKILKIFFISILSIALALSLVIYFISDKLEAVVLKEINDQLAVEGSFKDFEITFWETFPRVSLKINNLKLNESKSVFNKPFLEADKFYLQLNLWKAIRGKYELEKIKSKNVVVRMGYSKGVSNFDLFKENKDSSSSGLNLDLQSIEFINASYEFLDAEEKSYIFYSFDLFQSKGEINPDYIAFKVLANGTCNSFLLQGDTINIDKRTDLQTELKYSFEDEKLEFLGGNLAIDASDFEINGSIQFSDKNEIDLHLKSEGNSIKQVIGLLPREVTANAKDWESEGKFGVEASIKGGFEGKNTPEIDAKLFVSEASIQSNLNGVGLENLNIEASLFLGQKQQSLQLTKLSFDFDKQNFKAALDIQDFEKPKVVGWASGVLDLGSLVAFLGDSAMPMSGILDCAIDINSSFSQWGDAGVLLREGGIQGQITCTNVSLASDQYTLEKVNGTLIFDKNNLKSSSLEGLLNKYNGKASFNLQNYLSLLSSSPSVFGNLTIQLETINLDEIITNEAITETSENNDPENDIFESLKGMNLELKLSLKSLIYNKEKIENIRSKLSIENQNILINQLFANLNEGTLNVNGAIKKREDQMYLGRFELEGSKLNIQKLFALFGNFGQEEITEKNIEGKITFLSQIALIFDKAGNIQKENIYAFTDLSIENGVLKKVEAMKSLSKFAEISELENIRFQTLHNTFEISDGVLNFPYMDMGNSVLNLKIKGNHSFDNYMDYTFRVRLSEALASKYKWRSRKNKEEFEDFGDKGVALFINMKGYPDDLKFSVEKIGTTIPKVSGNTIVETLGTEKNELKDIIRTEFSKEKREERDKEKAEKESVDWDEF